MSESTQQRHRLRHAERVLREYPARHVQVLLAMAEREGRWSHVAWDVVRARLDTRQNAKEGV